MLYPTELQGHYFFGGLSNNGHTSRHTRSLFSTSESRPSPELCPYLSTTQRTALSTYHNPQTPCELYLELTEFALHSALCCQKKLDADAIFSDKWNGDGMIDKTKLRLPQSSIDDDGLNPSLGLSTDTAIFDTQCVSGCSKKAYSKIMCSLKSFTTEFYRVNFTHDSQS